MDLVDPHVKVVEEERSTNEKLDHGDAKGDHGQVQGVKNVVLVEKSVQDTLFKNTTSEHVVVIENVKRHTSSHAQEST